MTENDTIFKTLDEKNRDVASFSGNAMTARTLRNIKKSLRYTLDKKYDIQAENNERTANTILKIHGLNIEQFDTISNIENTINNRIINDESIDPNANKGSVTIEGIIQESVNPNKKAAGYDLLYRTMKKMYGKDEAKRLSGEMYSYALALSDATKILFPYCFSIDASKLVTGGRDFGQLKSAPSKHTFSYVSALTETIHQMSNHLAGAIAVGTFFIDLTRILIYTDAGHVDINDPTSPYYGYSLDEFIASRTIKKSVENSMQHFVHSVNHLSRSAIESPFTNLSVFDKPKLALLTADNEMGWMFDERPTWWKPQVIVDACATEEETAAAMVKEEKRLWHECVVNYIYEVQKVFIGFFDKGDLSQDGLPYRFPVLTANFSKFKDEETKKEYIKDTEFLDYMCHKDIYRYNIFCSTGTKIASCCFGKDERPLVKIDEGTLSDTFEELSRKITPNDIVKVKYNNSWLDAHLVKKPIEDHDMYEILLDDFRSVIVSDNHINCTDTGDKTTIELKNSDLIETDHGFVKIRSINKIKYNHSYIYCMEIINGKAPYFTLANGIVTHNCRLINDIEMMDFASQANSFGGVGISLGSHRVCTINFNRIALEAKSYDDYFNILNNRISSAGKILKSHKELLRILIDSGFHEFFKTGWLRLDRMFSTFGILGLVEAEETLKKKFGELSADNVSPARWVVDPDIIGNSLIFLNEKALEFGKKNGLIVNIEQIPAESMAPRLAKVDKLIFGEDKVPYILYANQFIPLWKEASVWDKMDADGKYNKLITGGGIAHIQINEKVTPTQAKKLVNYAMVSGCEHFALNAVYSQCDSCGHTHFGKIKICPKCGGQSIGYLTRVVGFFTRVKDWVKERRDWEFDKRTFVDLPTDDEEVAI